MSASLSTASLTAAQLFTTSAAFVYLTQTSTGAGFNNAAGSQLNGWTVTASGGTGLVGSNVVIQVTNAGLYYFGYQASLSGYPTTLVKCWVEVPSVGQYALWSSSLSSGSYTYATAGAPVLITSVPVSVSLFVANGGLGGGALASFYAFRVN